MTETTHMNNSPNNMIKMSSSTKVVEETADGPWISAWPKSSHDTTYVDVSYADLGNSFLDQSRFIMANRMSPNVTPVPMPMINSRTRKSTNNLEESQSQMPRNKSAISRTGTIKSNQSAINNGERSKSISKNY
jgi:hypothetical protein